MPCGASELTTARETWRSAKDCVDLCTAATWPRTVREANADPSRSPRGKASCVAADGVDRSQYSSRARLNRSRADARLAGAALPAAARVRALAVGRWAPGPICTTWLGSGRPCRGSSSPRLAAARSPRSSSPIELQHGVGAAPQDLTDALSAPELVLPADDERPMRAHVKDRDHGAATQRVTLAQLGDAIHLPRRAHNFRIRRAVGSVPISSSIRSRKSR